MILAMLGLGLQIALVACVAVCIVYLAAEPFLRRRETVGRRRFRP